MEMAIEGHTLAEIAKALGVSRTCAQKDVTTGIREITGPIAQTLAERREVERERSLARCEMLVRGSLPEACKGNTKAAETVLKAEARRARLLGLDAPTKTEVTIDTAKLKSMSDAELEALAVGAVENALATVPAATAELVDADADSDDGDDADDAEGAES